MENDALFAKRYLKLVSGLVVKRQSSQGSLSSENSPSVSPDTSRPNSETFESSESYLPENMTQNVEKRSNILEQRLKEEFRGHRRIFR